MPPDFLTWGAIIVALGSIIAAIKFWMDMGATKQIAIDAAKSSREAHNRIDRLTETVASNEDIAAAEKRFAEAVDGLRGDFRHMAGRLDALLVTLASKG